MDVALRPDLEPGKTHEERMAIARRIAELCLAEHGDKVAGIGVQGSTCVGEDLPWSDLDMTILTRVDLDVESRCLYWEGMPIQLDYQTIEDTIRTEVEVPDEGGCWETFLVLHDPDGVVADLRERYRRVTAADYDRRVAELMADQLSTTIGKIRNAVLSGDRAHFLTEVQDLGWCVCKALCQLNRHYVTGSRNMLPACRTLPLLPAGFDDLIDIILGVTAAPDPERCEAAEDLWAGMQELADAGGIAWRAAELGP